MGSGSDVNLVGGEGGRVLKSERSLQLESPDVLLEEGVLVEEGVGVLVVELVQALGHTGARRVVAGAEVFEPGVGGVKDLHSVNFLLQLLRHRDLF
jgi:hypothetical protein